MLLKSSSTPVLGSLISSISDQSPDHHHPELLNHPINKHPPATVPHSLNKLSFCWGRSENFTFSCNSSPISPCVSELSFGTQCTSNGFRRAHSEGNLESLANDSSDIDEFTFSKTTRKFSSRSSGSFLETIPSFSYHNSSDRYEDDEDSEYKEDEDEDEEIVKNQGQRLNHYIRTDFKKTNFEFNKEKRYANAYMNMELQKEIKDNSPMYLAKGLGISGLDINLGSGNGSYGGNGGPGDGTDSGDGTGAGDGYEKDLEEHYKKMVQDDPRNPLFLRNYAGFLYQTKKELQRAEEYYSRAILIDPKDGEILSQYAKLVWELHNDRDRATAYFERAVQAASEDSHVHAAYASFLWETEDEDEDHNNNINLSEVLPSIPQRGHMASATA